MALIQAGDNIPLVDPHARLSFRAAVARSRRNASMSYRYRAGALWGVKHVGMQVGRARRVSPRPDMSWFLGGGKDSDRDVYSTAIHATIEGFDAERRSRLLQELPTGTPTRRIRGARLHTKWIA